MFPQVGVLPVLAFALAGATAPAVAQPTEVTSATVSVNTEPLVGLGLTVRNLRDSPLIAWRIDLLPAFDAPSPLSRVTTDATAASAQGERAPAPLQPRESRNIDLPWRDDHVPEFANVTTAIFEDGYVEGGGDGTDALLRWWPAVAVDLEWWIQAFEEIPRSSPSDVEHYLRTKVIERGQSPDPSGLRAALDGRLHAEATVQQLLDAIDREYRPSAQRRLDAVTMARARGVMPPAAGRVKAVSVYMHRQAAEGLALRIENRGRKAIEAWVVETYTSQGTMPYVESADMCGTSQPEGAAEGKIQPGGVQEWPFLAAAIVEGDVRIVRLSSILFDDLTYEGAQADVDHLLRRRERLAADLAFYIDALRQASAKPANEAAQLLRAAWDEAARRASLQPTDADPAGRRPAAIGAAYSRYSSGSLLTAMAVLKATPDRFARYAQGEIKKMGEARAALLRHRLAS